MMTALPAASAGAVLNVSVEMGKLKGPMQATTPSGSILVNARSPMASPSAFWSMTVSPLIISAAEAESLSSVGISAVSERAMPMGLPISAVTIWASSSRCPSKISAALRRMPQRSLRVIAAHSFLPSWAASSARSTSSFVAKGAHPKTSPVAGLVDSLVAPSLAGTHSPAINISLSSICVLPFLETSFPNI